MLDHVQEAGPALAVDEHVEQNSDSHIALYVVNVDGPAHRRRITGANGSYMSFGWVP